ncbi:MAG: RdgB/HAM1 family non-canonical purine NTP pyrophosphatase [Oscillospiraceae bacterium]
MEIILASNNKGKLCEISKIVAPFGITAVSQKAAGFDFEVEETGTTFEENSLLKAKAVFERCKKPVIADDSGLEVDFLNKAPGVFSHRYAGENADDTDRCKKILAELEGVPEEKRTARFVCVLQYIDEKGGIHTVRGECEGKIGTEIRGNNGFGYDPIFMVGGKSFAEISAEEKNKISHRARALIKLSELLKEGN